MEMVTQTEVEDLLSERDELVKQWMEFTETLFENPNQARRRIARLLEQNTAQVAAFEMMRRTEDMSTIRADVKDPFAVKRQISSVIQRMDKISRLLLEPVEEQGEKQRASQTMIEKQEEGIITEQEQKQIED